MQYRRAAIYCIENTVFKPPLEWQVSHADVDSLYAVQGCFTEASKDFLKKITAKSATGQRTHLPPNMIESIRTGKPLDKSVNCARSEAELVVFTLVEEVLLKARIRPKDIDVLIINCSLFSPTPSLCAMVSHKFGMRSDIKSYNLSGMGCSANVISIDLAKQLLQNSPGSRALVVSTENITQNLYEGNDKSMLLQNTLFRVGGCAQLLSSRLLDVWKAKYKLLYTGRTQVSDTNSYQCVFEREDAQGHRGIGLSKDIVKVAGTAMKHNFVRLAPHVLPIREQAKTVATQGAISLVLLLKKTGLKFADRLTVPKGYVPNFARGIDHFCIHAGGRAVIEGVQENLRLSERHTLPSKATLHDWGNTSSSSIWYEAEWIERFGGLKAGHRVLQIAFGSGFKCNSAVWLALRVDESKRGVPILPSSGKESRNAAHLIPN
jgi:3-ketoacyl-CoA synthase